MSLTLDEAKMPTLKDKLREEEKLAEEKRLEDLKVAEEAKAKSAVEDSKPKHKKK